MDDVCQEKSRCGVFQVIFVIFAQLPRFATVWGFYIMMFGNYEPKWACLDHGDLDLSSQQRLLFTSGDATEPQFSKRSQNDTRYSRDSPTVSMDLLNVTTNATNYYNGSCQIYTECSRIVFEPGASTIVTEFGLICDKAWIASFIISMEMLAVVPGAYIGGQIGERFGRKVSLYGSTALMFSCLLLGIWSIRWEMYTVFSFFVGLGGGGILSTSVVYTMEYLSPWWRAMFASIPVWNASLAVFTLIIVWLRDWRLIHIASASMAGVAFLGVIWVPESIRWLEVHGKKRKAEKATRKIYRTKRTEHSEHLTIKDQDTVSGSDENHRQEDHKTYLDLFREPYIRSITLKAATAWLCVLIAYLAMGYGVKSLAGDFYVNAIIASVSEVPMMLIIGPVSNKMGRRCSAVSFITFAAMACCGIVVIHFAVEGDARGFTIKILALVAKACSAAAWCTLSTLSVELYPTVVRNLGYGFLTLVSRSGGIVAPYLIPQDPSWFAVCFSIMTVALIICIAVTISLPETKDKPLVDVIPEAEPMKHQDFQAKA